MNRRTDMQVAQPTDGASDRQNAGEGSQKQLDDDIIREVTGLVEALNGDTQFMDQLAGLAPTTLVLSATDTGREVMIALDGTGVRVSPYGGEPFDAMIQASEHVLAGVLTGEMDADTVFFARKARVRGSMIAAFRLKNRFLSFLQWHWTHRPEAGSECTETDERKGDRDG